MGQRHPTVGRDHREQHPDPARSRECWRITLRYNMESRRATTGHRDLYEWRAGMGYDHTHPPLDRTPESNLDTARRMEPRRQTVSWRGRRWQCVSVGRPEWHTTTTDAETSRSGHKRSLESRWDTTGQYGP